MDDGGFYRRTNPNDKTGDWFSLNGNLGATEAHDVAWDPGANMVMIGNQDTGTAIQFAEGDTRFFSFHTADGSDVAAFRDPSNPDQSIRYSSF